MILKPCCMLSAQWTASWAASIFLTLLSFLTFFWSITRKTLSPFRRWKLDVSQPPCQRASWTRSMISPNQWLGFQSFHLVYQLAIRRSLRKCYAPFISLHVSIINLSQSAFTFRDYHRTYQSCYLISIVSIFGHEGLLYRYLHFSLYNYDNWRAPTGTTRFVPYCIIFLCHRVFLGFYLCCKVTYSAS